VPLHGAILWHRAIEGSPRQAAGAMMAGRASGDPVRRRAMARLRHFAVCVKDLDKAAEFYAKVFDLKRVGREDLEIGSAIYMTDGVINLALLNFTGAAGSKASDIKENASFVGAHHFGFQVEDVAETQKRIEAHGGKFFFDLGDERHGNFERKFKDPDGVIFDISKNGWQGTDGYKK
jgi:predicted enzyme related to lactoylglutathione lyase